MIKRICDIFKEKKRTFSFEFFSPKTDAGITKLYDTAKEFIELDPDFLSVTYGACGSARVATTKIVNELEKRFNVSVLHHLTCIGHTKDKLTELILKIKGLGIKNILALRGDPPRGVKEWKKIPGGFEYSYQLCQHIRSLCGDYFCVGVAGFPEGHADCSDKDLDSRYLKLKIDSGADFVITQLFFDNKDYFQYVERLKKIGVKRRVIPGILPIVNYEGLVNFCLNCQASIPVKVRDIFEPLKDDQEAVYSAGIEFAVRQCRELLDGGAPGLHFFTLNKTEPVRQIFNSIKETVVSQ